VSGCDNTPELRARTRRSPRWDRERAAVHDFNNALQELVYAAALDRRELVTVISAELEQRYLAAIRGDAYVKKQRAAS
jgi:hypothetical protein